MPSILQMFQQAVSGNGQDPLKTAQMVGDIAGTLDTLRDAKAQELLMRILAPWTIGVVRLAPTKWLLPRHISPECQLDLGPGQVCGQIPAGACHLCGRPICLNHSLVGGDATLVCWTCMRVAREHVKPWQPPKRTAAPNAPSDLSWAYELLNVEPEASDKEIAKAFRKKISKFHPDRAPEAERVEYGELVKNFKRAYDAILKDRGSEP